MLSNKHLIIGFNCLLFSILLAVRILISGSVTYMFLIWNIFLAIIPWVISSQIQSRHKAWNSKLKLCLLGLVWLLFFPNAPYIITDLFHLKPKSNIPLWYDLILLLSATWIGLLLAYNSILQIEKVVRYYWGTTLSIVSTVLFIFISSFGIYLGRYLRWNSWDIIIQPAQFIGDIINQLFRPSYFFEPWSMTLIFGVFFCGLYWSVRYSSIPNH